MCSSDSSQLPLFQFFPSLFFFNPSKRASSSLKKIIFPFLKETLFQQFLALESEAVPRKSSISRMRRMERMVEASASASVIEVA